MRSLLFLDTDTRFLDAAERELVPAFRLFTANSVEQAIELLDSHPIELCVLDFKLGREDGREVLAYARRNHPQFPCILVTANANKRLAIEALNLGMNGLLEKPVELAELREKIEKLLPPLGDVAQWELLPETFSVVMSGKRVVLTPIEFQILRELWANRNRLVRREELCEKLWGLNRVTIHTFDTHFSNMKRKLPGLRSQIQVIRGQGYVLHL